MPPVNKWTISQWDNKSTTTSFKRLVLQLYLPGFISLILIGSCCRGPGFSLPQQIPSTAWVVMPKFPPQIFLPRVIYTTNWLILKKIWLTARKCLGSSSSLCLCYCFAGSLSLWNWHNVITVTSNGDCVHTRTLLPVPETAIVIDSCQWVLIQQTSDTKTGLQTHYQKTYGLIWTWVCDPWTIFILLFWFFYLNFIYFN